MAQSIMVLGTMSNVGKSVLTAGLCRIFKQDGYKTAPFKSQNMALNSYITAEGLEMGRAQVMQAECAKTEPDVRMNPILLKPTNDQGSQVIVNGEVLGYMRAADYFAYKKSLIPTIQAAFQSLSEDYEVIVIEGAGSPAEINLKQDDIVNMGLAKMTNTPCILVGDIDRGGVFASLFGTLALLDDDERRLIKGVVINKFRGDLEILKPGLAQLEALIGLPVLGVIPHMPLAIDEEDSLAERLYTKREQKPIDIVVIRLPHVSNFTDFSGFENRANVSLRYVDSVKDFQSPDLCILPGTKNTMGDLLWLRQCGLAETIREHANENKPVFGICGGYQMLGERLYDPDSVEHGGEMVGLSLLPIETTFTSQKTRTRVTGVFHPIEGVFKHLTGKTFTGYEIHMGETTRQSDALALTTVTMQEGHTKQDGQHTNHIFGTYIHGIVDGNEVVGAILQGLCEQKNIPWEDEMRVDTEQAKEEEYDKLAQMIRSSIDIKKIYEIMKESGEKADACM